LLLHVGISSFILDCPLGSLGSTFSSV